MPPCRVVKRHVEAIDANHSERLVVELLLHHNLCRRRHFLCVGRVLCLHHPLVRPGTDFERPGTFGDGLLVVLVVLIASRCRQPVRPRLVYLLPGRSLEFALLRLDVVRLAHLLDRPFDHHRVHDHAEVLANLVDVVFCENTHTQYISWKNE